MGKLLFYGLVLVGVIYGIIWGLGALENMDKAAQQAQEVQEQRAEQRANELLGPLEAANEF